jgi:hypothetical protein
MTMERPLLFVLTALLTLFCSAQLAPHTPAPLGRHLVEVNAQWAVQGLLPDDASRPVSFRDEVERIAMHLRLVRERLEQRAPEGLSAAQQAARHQLLEDLGTYADAGVFPRNYVLPYRNPVFIDPHGMACAVGQLMIASGHGDLAHRIDADMELAYVLDMEWPEIGTWASEHGFSANELAWIQPGYPPNLPWTSLGGGTNGEVTCMLPLATGDLLLCGAFTQAGSVSANGVAVWNGTSFSSLGSGLQGQVSSAVEHNGVLYVGGAMLNGPSDLAKWDGTAWTFTSVFEGKYPVINALHVHNGELYAAGSVSGIAGVTEFVQRWDGAQWLPVGVPFDGPVLALASHNGELVAGGAFNALQGPPMPQVRHVAAFGENGWHALGDGVDGTVRDLLDVNGVLYAAGQAFANITPTFGLARITVGAPAWELLLPNLVNYMQPWLGSAEVRSIAAHDGHIYFGGNFFISLDIMVMGTHVGRWDGEDQVVELAAPDQSANSVAVREGRLIMAGGFSTWQPHVATLDLATGLRDDGQRAQMTVFPQPAGTEVFVQVPGTDLTAAALGVLDAAGRRVNAPVTRLGDRVRIDVSGLASGTYHIRLAVGAEACTARFIKP